ncbi:unnamed protein product [Amaranthus hypochondriacus]
MGTELLYPQNCLVNPKSKILFSHCRTTNPGSGFGSGSRSRSKSWSRIGTKSNKEKYYYKTSIGNKRPYIGTRDMKASPKNHKGHFKIDNSNSQYAGTTFVISPSPTSLPLPSFSNRMMPIDGFATKELRRLLRLE